MLNMLEAFAVSLKHYLRGESGLHYEDLYHLVLFLPKVRNNVRSGITTDTNFDISTNYRTPPLFTVKISA